MKPFFILAVAFLSTTSTVVQSAETENIAEVMLAASLDESRGYCLDIAGGKGALAPIERGLQAHTCYNYTGEILEDQGFDLSLISKGVFRISYFDVCMSASSLEQNASLQLEECNSSVTQQFELKDNGQLSLNGAPNLCVTVDGENKKEGRGGTPVHVMRPVSLQLCDDSKSDYQQWIIKSL
ncbi:RICIN domain-containing protein [Vibrio sp. E150_011]